MVNQNSRILVTGGEGFVGSHLVKYLKEDGIDVYSTSKHNESKTNKIYKVNITNKHKVDELIKKIKPDYLIHLAAISNPIDCNISSIYDVNLGGSINLLESISRYSNKCSILLVSSAYVYGNREVIVNEDEITCPIDHYGNSKVAMENLARVYESKINKINIVRPFNHIGEGQSDNFILPKIINTIKKQMSYNKKLKLDLGNIEAVRDFTSVMDVIRAYRMILESGCNQTIYNVSSNKGYSIIELVSIIESIVGNEIVITVNNKYLRSNNIPYLVGNNEKIKREVGWKPKLEISEILNSMIF